MKIFFKLTTSLIFLILPIFAFSQNVGIGTSSPSDALHIKSASGANALRVQVGSSTKFRVLSNGGTTIGTNNASGTSTDGLYVHGNTGLGVNNPSDKLAVNGDINIVGEIKPNGNTGTEGQLLQSNGDGTMDWVDPCNFKYFDQFYGTGPSTWTVPAGVSEVMFELWGAGGGGSPGGGGGGGTYLKFILQVTPGDTYAFSVGAGGAGGNSTGSGGGQTSVSGPGLPSLWAGGGYGALVNSPGSTGGFSVAGTLPYVVKKGAQGHTNEVNYAEYSSGNFAKIVKYGNGGNGGNTISTYGVGGVRAADGNTEIFLSIGQKGLLPGGGGGGGSPFGYNGGDGTVIVHW